MPCLVVSHQSTQTSIGLNLTHRADGITALVLSPPLSHGAPKNSGAERS